jgi:signal transduction histidine kinase
MTADRPSLLVVDDEPEVLQSLHELFRRDYQVLAFTRGAEALDALDARDVPVVLSDQRMPGMSGLDFLGRVAKVRPDATRLLFTGYSDFQTVIDAINRGHVFRYITKPWDAEELASTIRQAVERHDLVVERRRLLGELERSNARLREADRLKRAFIEVASHELNTPVSIVLGITALWTLRQSGAASTAERLWVERISAAGRRLAATVEKMLKLLEADSFDRPLELRATELAPLLEGVAGDLQPFLEARRQVLLLDIDPALGAVDIDAPKVADSLTHLLMNAIKFTPDGGQIRVSASPVDGEWVRIEVADSGSGISPADSTHVFEPFFTGYDTLHHSSGEYQYGKRGIGLGLCLVKRFIELHGGTVELSSGPGQGATFTLTLPRRPSAPSDAGSVR